MTEPERNCRLQLAGTVDLARPTTPAQAEVPITVHGGPAGLAGQATSHDGSRVLAWVGGLRDSGSELDRIINGDASTVDRLNSIFALAVWDRNQHELELATDRYGNIPLYYAIEGPRLAFGTSAAAVVAALDRRPELDRLTLSDLLWFGHPVGDRTLFAGVRKLPPASVWNFSIGGLRKRTYWRLRFAPADPDEGASLLAGATRAFIRAVDRATAGSDVALALTGGQDTRAILAAALKLGRRPAGFCAAVAGANDATVARRLGRALNGRFHEYQVGPDLVERYPALAAEFVRLTEGALGLEHVHGLCLSEHCRGRWRCLVDGGGARVSKRGFLRRAGHRRGSHRGLARLVLDQYGRPDVVRTLTTPDQFRDETRQKEGEVTRLLEDVRQPTSEDTLDAYFLRQNWANFYAGGVALQAQSIEGRLPFLDYAFIDAASRLPLSLRRRSALQARVVADGPARLGRLPRVFCDVTVPWTENRVAKYSLPAVNHALERIGIDLGIRRACFPFERWCREGLAGELSRGVCAFAERGVFDHRRMGRLAGECANGQLRALAAAVLVWRLELWHRAFIDG